MVAFIVAPLLILVALLTLTLEKTYFYVPKKELKRQAAYGDQLAKTLYRAVAYGDELKLVLWAIMGLSAAGGIVLFARVAPPLLGLLVVVVVIWLGFEWLPRTKLTLTGARLAEWCTPALVPVLRVMHPLLHWLTSIGGKHHAGNHTGLYERDDMGELLERQSHQSDNRISEVEMERMRKALQFGRLKVADIVVPRSQVLAVNASDNISPIMLDELHKSGHVRFPVYEGEEPNIVGTLQLAAISDTRHRGAVQDYYDPHLAYMHEGDNLEHALRAFYETHQHLFIVINGADEYVGIITLSDILRHLAGGAGRKPFGHFDDRKAVINHHRKHTSRKHTPPETAEPLESTASENSENMVE